MGRVRARVRLVKGAMSLVRPRLARAELENVVGRSAPDHADPEIEASRSQLRQRRSQMLPLFDATPDFRRPCNVGREIPQGS
jgi:hypothetical protein